MNRADSDDDRADELTERYRAASAEDPARPSDSVRQSILAHARTVAADHAPRGTATARTRRHAAYDSSWRITAAASVIVAGFVTVLTWHFHRSTPFPTQEPNAAPSNIAAHNQPAAEGTASSQPPESLPADRLANTTLAPNAVTTRSKQRTVAPAEAAREIGTAHNAAADLEIEGGSAASSRQAPAKVAVTTATARASEGSKGIDVEGGQENPIATAQVAPSAAAPPPPNVEARASPALSAAAGAPTRAAPSILLVIAAESGNLERVDQLLRSGVSTEQADARGRTALLVATLRGDMPMVRRLLAAGARVDAVDGDGDTPLAAARRQGPPELARLLERATHP
jgi:Ankyrin repeats (3 copies)